jgi:hypothetical protein
MERMQTDNSTEIRDEVRSVFSAEAGSKLYVNLERVPLLCQNVMGIQDMLKEQRDDIKEIKKGMNELPDKFVTQKEFALVRAIVFGGIGILLTGILIALLVKIIPGFRLS